MTDKGLEIPQRPWLRAVAQWAMTLGVLWFVFVFLLPRFINYREVVETLSTLKLNESAALLLFTIAYSVCQSLVYTVVIPGLRFWPGWQAYEASGTLASFTPTGVDMAVRYGMYRSFGIPAASAGAGFVLSGLFTIGVKFVLPVFALLIVLISGDYTRGTTIVTVLAVALAAIVLTVMILRREALARGMGRVVGGWYNRLLAGKWKFESIEDPGEKFVGFRSRIVGTLGDVWHKAALAQLAAHTASFVVLLLALRFLGVSPSDANFGVVFVAYALGLIASLTPFLPQGLGAVELVYVLVIAGTEESELADAVMAAAFTHRIFTWLIPILWGFIPLLVWRRRISRANVEVMPVDSGTD